MATATRYATTKTEHGLLVRDVVLAVEGDTGRGFSLTRDDFKKFAGTFQRRSERGHIGAFVRLGHDGPRIGKIVALSPRDGEMIGDLLLEKQYDPESKLAARIEADSISDLSVTFAHKAGALVDVSLLEDTFGQLHEKLPPFKVDVKTEFEIEPSELTALSFKKESEMTKEEFAAMLAEANKPILERLTKLETGDKADPSVRLSADPEVDDAVAAARAGDLAELKKLKRGLMVDGYLAQLSAVAGGATARQQKLWREKLVECESDEACTERFERLKLEIGHKTTKLDTEAPFGKVGVAAQLRDEYKALGGETRLHITEDEYVAKWSNNELMTTDLR